MLNLSTKSLTLIIACHFMLLSINTYSQCLSGNCEDGIGIMTLKNGTYSGNFKNGLPNGEGIFNGRVMQKNTMDSVQDQGTFVDGFFLKGQRKVIISWRKILVAPSTSHYGQQGYGTDDGYWMVPTEVLKADQSYPAREEYSRRVNGKTVKQDVWNFYGVNKVEHLFWTGNLKNGLLQGAGELHLSCSRYDKVIAIDFDKGLLTGNPVIKRWDAWESKYALAGFTIKDGLVDEQTILMDGDTLVQKSGASLYSVLQSGELGNPEGYFTKKYKSGIVYTGMLKNGLPHGLGAMTYNNGNVFQGFFYEDYRMGPGKMVTTTGTVDSGFYFLGKFLTGIVRRTGKPTITFPACVSGNCTDGKGIARYTLVYNDTLNDTYEGNFVNGMPAGYGEWQYKRGAYAYTKKGTFATGILNGYGEIAATGGIIRKLKGIFKNDTLMSGSIYYNDGSSFEAAKFDYEPGLYLKMKPVIFAISNRKELGGYGIYRTATGNILTGQFNPYDNSLLLGSYQNAAGIVINNFGRQNDPFANMRLSSVAFDVDRIDNYVTQIVAQIQWNEQQRIEAAKAYAVKAERDRIFDAQYNNPQNFVYKSGYIQCNACKGEGRFVYTNTFGGNVVREEMDSKGGWKKVEYVRTGRTYTNKVTCDACNGKGRILVNGKTYLGPAY